MTRTWLLVAAIGLLVAAILVSPQMLASVVILGIVGCAVWQVPRLRPYQWTLPLAALLLLSLITQILALPGVIASALLVLVAAIVLAHAARRGNLQLPQAGLWSALGVAAVPLVTLALSSLVTPAATISWVMMGDGFEWVRYLGDLRALAPLELLTSGLFPRLTMSTELLARTVLLPGSAGGLDGLLADVHANVAWVVLGVIAAFADLARGFGERRRSPSSSRMFVQGLLVALVMCSTLVLGLVAANGFLSVSTTIALFVMSLIGLDRFVRCRDRTGAVIALLGAVCLVTSWQPFALVVAGLLVGVLVRGIVGRWWPVVAGVAITVLTVGAVLLTTGSIPAAGAGHFPATPVAVLAVTTSVALVLAARGASRTLAQLIAIAFVAGSVSALYSFSDGNVWGLLASIHDSGITPYYYVEKFIWIAGIPAVALVIILLTSPSIRIVAGSLTSTLAITVFVLAAFTAAQVPNFAWLPLGSRSDVLELGELVLDPTVMDQPRVFVGYQAPHVDAVINSWDGLLRDRYLTSGAGTGAERKDVVLSAVERGDLPGAACAAAAIGGPITIVTGQPTLEADAGLMCPESLAQVRFDVRVDRGI
jgi:hypothetical protein